MTDDTGAVLERYAYSTYGRVTNLDDAFAALSTQESAIDNNYLYTGRRLDPETGLQLNRHRFYASHLGRWINRDPIRYLAGDMNLYGYVLENPIRFLDLLGLEVSWCVRDLASSPLGNHAFLLLRPDNMQDFPLSQFPSVGGSPGRTCAAFKQNGNLVNQNNNFNDVASIEELNGTSNNGAGWDAECHTIPTPSGMTDSEFINLILFAAQNYQANTATTPVTCNLGIVGTGPGCNRATWVNSVLAASGIDEPTRNRLGEFKGIDWGEENLIPISFFAPPLPPPPPLAIP